MPAVWFAHGLDGVPWGRKITALAAVARQRGLEVESPDYGFTRDPDARVRHLLSQNPPEGDELILVGWNDDIIPVDNAWRFARAHRASLHVLDAGHTLTERLEEVEALFRRFLEAVLAEDV